MKDGFPLRVDAKTQIGEPVGASSAIALGRC
jgi:hypothetical protein